MAKKFDQERILIAGFGGQGIIVAGKLLAAAAIRTVQNITLLAAYGAEVRGGTCNCQVMLADGEIASPNAEEFDAMLIMNQESADKYLARRAAAGMAIVNTSLCACPAGQNTICVPATETAGHLGDIRVANMIMLGAYAACRQVIPPEALEKGIETTFSRKGRAITELNLKAFRAGFELASKALQAPRATY